MNLQTMERWKYKISRKYLHNRVTTSPTIDFKKLPHLFASSKNLRLIQVVFSQPIKQWPEPRSGKVANAGPSIISSKL
jgi:hypothetical protein